MQEELNEKQEGASIQKELSSRRRGEEKENRFPISISSWCQHRALLYPKSVARTLAISICTDAWSAAAIMSLVAELRREKRIKEKEERKEKKL